MLVKSILFLLFTPALILAQNALPHQTLTQYHLDVWQEDEGGPPQSVVQTLAQTPDGYLWLGQEEGLVRFDGVKFTRFHKGNTAAFTDHDVQALCVDRDSSLWIGTEGGGLVRLQKGKFTAFTTTEGLVNNIVLSLCQDRLGRLWVGTADGLSVWHDGKFTNYASQENFSPAKVNALHEDRAGNLWIGTDGGGLTSFKDGKFTPFAANAKMASDQVWDVYEDRAGRLWIATLNGLHCWQQGELKLYTMKDGLAHNNVRDIFEDRAGRLLLATYGGGVSRYDANTGAFETFSSSHALPHDFVHTVFEDREGSVWIGAHGGGLSRLREAPFANYSTADGLSYNSIKSIYEDRRGNLWIGSENGLNRWRDGRVTVYRFKGGATQNYILALHEDRAGNLWIGTDGGGVVRRRDENLVYYTTQDGLPSNFIRAFCEDRAGNLWMCSPRGLIRFKDGKFKTFTTHDGLSSNEVANLCEDRDGNLWISTRTRGLNRWRDERFTHYTTQDGLSTDLLRPLYADKNGVLWIGSNGGGLNRFKDGQFTAYTTKVGLFDDVVFQILEDDRNNLWMSCNAGIFCVSKQELDDFAEGKIKAITCTVYGKADGMNTNECNGGSQPAGWKTRDGRLWFPTIAGVAVVDPNNLKRNPAPPPVAIEDVVVNQQKLAFEAGLALAPGSRDIEIHYTALSFIAPQKIQFRYKLEGYDNDWVDPAGRRTAFYTNLPPKEYTFRVKACNSDGVWNETGAALNFAVQPYFYQTTLFYFLCGLGLLLTGAGAYAWRVRRVHAQARELAELVSKRTQALQQEIQVRERAQVALQKEIDEHQCTEDKLREAKDAAEKARLAAEAASEVKSRFLANMSHEIRTPLNGILGMTALLLDTPLEAKQRDFARIVRASADTLLRVINDILDFSKIEAGKLDLEKVEFDLRLKVEDLVELLALRAHEKGLALACRIDPAIPQFIKGDPVRLQQVLLNLLGNAVKFTERGEIFVQASLAAEAAAPLQIRFEVSDTGIGIAPESLPHIFDPFIQADNAMTRRYGGTGLGLSIVKQLVDLMGGQLEVESAVGKGSRFGLVLPFEKAAASTFAAKAKFEKLRLLIIDDHAKTRQVLREQLMAWGCEVDEISGGEAAREKFNLAFGQSRPYDLALLAENLKDGAFASMLHKRPEASGPRLVLLALTQSRAEAAPGRAKHFAAVLNKPVRAQALYDCLHGLVNAGDQPPERSAELAAPRRQRQNRARILLVDDDITNQAVAALILQKFGYDVEIARNGKMALHALEEKSFDVVFMDVQMPDLDGIAATQIIRDPNSKICNHRVPIIAMTAHSMAGDEERFRRAGMDDYISKPFDPDILPEVIGRYVKA